MALEEWFGKHPVFLEGHEISATNNLFAEFRACMALGLDPDQYFQKDKFSRMLIVGGYIADSAVSNMRAWDLSEERARKAEAESKRKHRR